MDSEWQTAEFGVEWDKGINRENIGHGRENTKNYLSEHPELMDTIRATVLGQEESDTKE